MRRICAATAVRVIPGTWNRRVILQARLTTRAGAPLDVYCNHLSPRFDDFVYAIDTTTGVGAWQPDPSGNSTVFHASTAGLKTGQTHTLIALLADNGHAPLMPHVDAKVDVKVG